MVLNQILIYLLETKSWQLKTILGTFHVADVQKP